MTITAIIQQALAQAKRPAALCSGGKDSQVMLHHVLRQKPDIEVIYFEGLPHPTKHTFINQQIAQHSLNIVKPLPAWRDFIANGSHVQMVEVFNVSAKGILHFPIEAAAGHQPTAQSQCAIDAFNAPTNADPMPYDVLFIGHRGDDADEFWGEIGAQEYMVDVDGVTMIYPLRDYSEADIWRESSELGIPQNEARYFAQDLSQNNDYYDLCTQCLTPGAGAYVTCPKDGLPIINGARLVNLESARQEWRKSFVNLEAA